MMRHSLLDILGSSAERVGGLAVMEWNDVTSPVEAVGGQDRAKDQLCVRLTSTRLSQLDGEFGRKRPLNSGESGQQFG